ncbi:folate-binding protein [Cryobacterium sp. CG_9.6]|uniref:CAF17-like 4Fe-4S cluster assembly/insertion protein YgfZ n=1 Tax=Cryobacterium sp. CG_9.6 TaxID=2760710 RepID=UPI0024768E9A|nr:folate-binding protein [Cryobacterium sp. CG_9.6]MDH6237872.1 folate-binding protein YgfZ [Cryobacterium sp. CG_9.6]
MTSPVLSPLLSLDGAVQAEGIDAGVAAHYGNPMIEQRSLLAGRALVDLSHHGVLAVSGPDRLTWLNSIASQELRSLAPGESTETLLLDPSGRLEYAIRVLDDGVQAWLLVEADELPGLQAFLDKMKFTLRVQIVDFTLSYAAIGTMATDPAEVLGALGAPVTAPNGSPLLWTDPWVSVARGGYQYAETPEHPGASWHWAEALVPRSSLPALAVSLAAQPATGTVPAGLIALEALRIAAWRPRRAMEVDDKTLPHELDWLRTAVHLNKGCYRGQETVAKVHNLGHPPRRLVMLHLDGSEGVLPVHGDPVQADRRRPTALTSTPSVSDDAGVPAPSAEPAGDTERVTVGTITSSAIHYELGPIALAVVKRTIPAASTLYVSSQDVSISAAQEIIVPQSAGSVAEIPRLPRLGVRTPRP